MTLRNAMVERRGDPDDAPVLGVHGEVAADSAIPTDCVHPRLARFVPGAGLSHIVFGLEHQRAGGAHADTIAAVYAGGIGQRNIVLGGDMRAKAASGDSDGECALRVGAASFNALVAEYALRVIAHVQIVIDLWSLCGRRRRRAEPLWPRAVSRQVRPESGRSGYVHR